MLQTKLYDSKTMNNAKNCKLMGITFALQKAMRGFYYKE